MWTLAEIATAAVAIIMLIGVVGVRSLSAGRIEVRLTDAVIVAVAAGLTLFLSGGISKLMISNTGLTVERAIVSASQRPVTSQVTPLPVVPMEEALKLGPSEIPNYVRREVQALEFVLGSGSYDPGVTRLYLETLSK